MLDSGRVRLADETDESSETSTQKNTHINNSSEELDTSDKTLFIKSPTNIPIVDTPSVSLEGSTLKNRYYLESKIGSGGMSDVYRAKDIFLENTGIKDNHVVIKVLQSQFVNQPEALQLLLEEAHKTQLLSHPNIVSVFDVDSDQDRYFIVMEYLDGESLDQIIRRYKPKGLSLTAAMKLLEQIADALNYAHKRGIVHADLKPANIMVDRHGHIKILDFGVAHRMQLNYDAYAAAPLSQNSPINGFTPAYASTDLLAEKTPAVSDDVFSFACVIYELLTSKHPFDRMPADKAQAQHKIASKPSHLNVLQWLALKKALNFNTADRNISISSLMTHLKRELWKPTLATIAVLAVLGGVSYQIYAQENKVAQVQAKQTQFELDSRQLLAFADLDAKQFLATLPSLEMQDPIIRAGLLRQQRENIFSYVEQQVDLIFTDKQHDYPDYPKMQSLLSEARALYPDSYFLLTLNNNMARGKQTAIDVLRERLASFLLQQNYSHQTNGNDIYKIVANFEHIDPQYSIQLQDNEIQAFIKAFDQAKQELDPIVLEQLINAGNLLFSGTEQTKTLISQGNQLKTAVKAMSIYHQAIAKGQQAAFPYSDATVFYQNAFATLENLLVTSKNSADVDEVYQRFEAYTPIVPSDFSPYNELRKQLADKYLNLGSQLLEARKVKDAERQIRRANELMNNK